MFENLTTEEKTTMCDEQIKAVDSLIYSVMLSLSLDPSSVDPATIVVDANAEEGTQAMQAEVVGALARRSFIEGVKAALP